MIRRTPSSTLTDTLVPYTTTCRSRTAGERLCSNPNSKIFRRDYLQQTHDFYDKHGGKTVTRARFLPIIRTFAPFVAGVGKMPYPRFFGFNVLGTILWVGDLEIGSGSGREGVAQYV